MRNPIRKGLTLVELLVTLGVVMLLAAIILPSVKSLLTDRKSTQSATVVRNFIEAARARAIGSNMAVSVVLERGSSIPYDRTGDGVLDSSDMLTVAGVSRFQSATAIDPLPAGSLANINFAPYNTCIRLSLAERPRPRHSSMAPTWSGPSASLQVIDALIPANQSLIADGFVGYGLQPGTIYLHGASVTDGMFLALQHQIGLLPFSEISLGGESTRYTVKAMSDDVSRGLWIALVSNTAINQSLELTIPHVKPIGTYSQFTVYPKPRPIVGQSVTLPRGMCIDLSLSGFGEVGSLPSLDRRFRFSSVWVNGGTAAVSPEQLRPVYLEFGSDGILNNVWANGNGTVGEFLVPSQLVDDVYLHIGKTDQVMVPDVLNPADPIIPNLYDEKSYIVRVSSKSGSIAVAPIANYQTQSELTGINLGNLADDVRVKTILSLGRLGVLGQPLTGQ